MDCHDLPDRSPSRVGYLWRDDYMDFSDPDSSLSSSADAVDSGTLPPIPEKPINQLTPAPKRGEFEELDDTWFRSHLAEVIELDLFTKGCPYFWKSRVKRWPQSVLRDMTEYVNLREEDGCTGNGRPTASMKIIEKTK